MRFRTKLLFWWAGVVLLLVAGMLVPILGIIQQSFERIAEANFAGMRQSVNTLQAERVERLRNAGEMVMNIPELRALIAEGNYEISSDNLSSLQERLDTYVKILGVDFACVLDDHGRLIAQNAQSPWKKLTDLRDFFADEPEGPALVNRIFQGNSTSTQTGVWVYGGKLYQVVGLPLVFGENSSGNEAPSGALIVATPWTNQLATELGLSHNCDVAFLSRDSILACSLPTTARQDFARAYGTAGWTKGQLFSLAIGGADYRGSLDPLVDSSSGREVAAFLILSRQNDAAAIRAAVLRNLVITAVCGLVMAATLSFLLSGAVTRPVRVLADGVRRVAAGDLDWSIPVKRSDELGQLAAAYNDMVVQLRTRRELQRLVEESQAANKAKSQFLANMSHELRTPLHGMMGITNLLLDTELTERQRHYMQMVRTSTEVLTTLINDILDFSKIEAGKLDLEKVEFNLHSTTEDVVELMSHKAFAKSVEIVCDIAPEVPVLALGDPTRIRQILLNLVGNAIKFTEQGEVIVRAGRETADDGKLSLRFEITDTGIGIPPERIDRLFQSFSQVDASTTRRFGGTGLGLAICKQLVEMMGGQIGVRSTEGKGSTFWFTISLAAIESHAKTETSELRGRAALVVIPNQSIREIVCRQLQTAGMHTTAFATGDDAMRTPTQTPFAVAIVDHRALGRQAVLATGKPTVLLTDAHEAAAAQASVVKPVRKSVLLRAVSEALGLRPKAGPVKENAAQPTPRNNFRILVAEDNEINQIVAKDFLSKAGFEAMVVPNGKVAVEAFSAGKFDLVLMDCQMPVMDGFEATRAIRDHEKNRATPKPVPIIALTANASGADRERCEQAGMNGYCGKPFKPRELLDTVWSFLSDKTKPEPQTPAATPPDAPKFDVESLIQRCSGNPTLALSILEKFEKQAAATIADIEQSLAAGDAEHLGKLSHSLKGSAGMVGADSIRSVAAELEKIGKNGTLESAETTLASLRKAVQECFAQLPAIRSDLNAASKTNS